MKFGVYHLIWAPPLTDAEFPALVERARRAGAEVLEIAASRDTFPLHARSARQVLQAAGLEGTLVTTVSPETDIGSEDASVRRRGEEHLARYLGTAEELGSAILAGPLYGPVWNPTLLSAGERASRRGRCIEGLARLGERAQNHGARIAIEPLSRFHTSFLNTAADGLRLVEEVGHPAVGLLLDTFQMNIEEKRLGDAIRLADGGSFTSTLRRTTAAPRGADTWTGTPCAMRCAISATTGGSSSRPSIRRTRSSRSS